jgi:hypothetical protein
MSDTIFVSIDPTVDIPDTCPTVKIACQCSLVLEIPEHYIEEMSAGVWGPILCPKCSTRLNEKISSSLLGEPAVTHTSG